MPIPNAAIPALQILQGQTHDQTLCETYSQTLNETLSQTSTGLCVSCGSHRNRCLSCFCVVGDKCCWQAVCARFSMLPVSSSAMQLLEQDNHWSSIHCTFFLNRPQVCPCMRSCFDSQRINNSNDYGTRCMRAQLLGLCPLPLLTSQRQIKHDSKLGGFMNCVCTQTDCM